MEAIFVVKYKKGVEHSEYEQFRKSIYNQEEPYVVPYIHNISSRSQWGFERD